MSESSSKSNQQPLIPPNEVTHYFRRRGCLAPLLFYVGIATLLVAGICILAGLNSLNGSQIHEDVLETSLVWRLLLLAVVAIGFSELIRLGRSMLACMKEKADKSSSSET